MAQMNERVPFPDNVWYDANNPGTLHDALRADYARTKVQAAKRPSLRRHIESCSVCQAIGTQIATAPSPASTRKRIKLVINKTQMHQLLKLPENFEIVHMFADNDPNIVSVLVAGEGLPMVDPDTDTPIGAADDVAETMIDRTS